MKYLVTFLNKPDAVKAESLEKSRPGPAFPRLGIERAKDTPIISTIRQLHIAHSVAEEKQSQYLREMHGDFGPLSSSHKPKTFTPSEGVVGQRPSSEEGGPGYAEYHKPLDMPARGEGVYGTTVRADRLSRAGASAEATKHHEDFHGTIARVRDVFGHQKAKNLCDNMLEEVRRRSPAAHYAVKTYYNHVKKQSPVSYPEHSEHHSEEALAHLISYVNDPAERTHAHWAPGLIHHNSRDFDGAMKVAYNHLIDVGKKVHHGWMVEPGVRIKREVGPREAMAEMEGEQQYSDTMQRLKEQRRLSDKQFGKSSFRLVVKALGMVAPMKPPKAPKVPKAPRLTLPKAPKSAKSPKSTNATPARVEKNPAAQRERVGQPAPVVPPKLHLAKSEPRPFCPNCGGGSVSEVTHEHLVTGAKESRWRCSDCGFHQKTPKMRKLSDDKKRWVIVNKALHENAMQGKMSSGGNRLTQIPAMRLYLNIDPYSDHHGHGFWAGKYDTDRTQDQYVVNEQDVGRPMLNVNHYYEDDVPPEVEDETVKAVISGVSQQLTGRAQPRLNIRSGVKVHAGALPRAMIRMEPKILRRLHGRPPRRAKLKFATGGHHGHPAIVIRTKKRMPRLGHGMKIKIRRTVRRKK